MDSEKIQENKRLELTPDGKGALATGGGLLAIDVLTHAGPAGLLIAGIGTFVAARHTSDFLYMKESLAARFFRSPEKRQEQESVNQLSDERTFGEKLFGKTANPKKNITRPK